MRRRTLLAAALLMAAITLSAIAWLREPKRPEARFATLAGQTVALTELRGTVVLVDFWATDCEICVEEMPSLVDNYRRFAARGYDVVAVALASDHPNRVAEFVQQRSLPFKVALDLDGSVARAFGEVPATPTLFLLDKEGRVLHEWRGRTDWRALSAAIEKALAS